MALPTAPGRIKHSATAVKPIRRNSPLTPAYSGGRQLRGVAGQQRQAGTVSHNELDSRETQQTSQTSLDGTRIYIYIAQGPCPSVAVDLDSWSRNHQPSYDAQAGACIKCRGYVCWHHQHSAKHTCIQILETRQLGQSNCPFPNGMPTMTAVAATLSPGNNRQHDADTSLWSAAAAVRQHARTGAGSPAYQGWHILPQTTCPRRRVRPACSPAFVRARHNLCILRNDRLQHRPPPRLEFAEMAPTQSAWKTWPEGPTADLVIAPGVALHVEHHRGGP